MLCNICNKHTCTYVHIYWRMYHHWGFLATCFGQMVTN
jgi:hypothetical protein